MTDQPPRRPRRGPPQFPDTPKGQLARRELDSWTAQYRKQAELERRVEVLLERISELQTERSNSSLLAILDSQTHTIDSLVKQVHELHGEIRELQRHPFPTEPPRQLILPQTPAEVDTGKHYTPQRKEWRTWRGFRRDIIKRYEAHVRAHQDPDIPGLHVPIEIEDIAGDSRRGDSEKTIKKVMCFYGLDPKKDWPPTEWPEDDPRIKSLPAGGSHTLAAVLAIAPFVLMLDAVLRDRAVDGIVHLSRLVGCLFGDPF